MTDTKTLEELMDEFYAIHAPNPAGANWRDAPTLDDDDDFESEARDLDTVIEEFIGRIR